MKEIQQREFNRAIAVLEALGCEYKIITKDGDQFGGLEVAVEKHKRRAPNRYPYGTLTNHVRALMNFDLNSEKKDFKGFGLRAIDEFRPPEGKDTEQLAVEKFLYFTTLIL